MMKISKISVSLIVLLLLLPVTNAMAAITQINEHEFEVTDHRVTIPAGSAGSAVVGGGKFQPAEAKGSYLSEVLLKTNRTLDSNNFVTVTFDNGVENVHRSEPGEPSVFAIASGLLNNPSKGITVKLTSDGSRERWVEIVGFKTIDSLPPGGGGPDPGGGGGTNPGGGSNDGTPVNHNYFYKPWDDVYRLDFWGQPSSTNTIKLIFTSSTGTVYDREWPASDVGGTLYLTCRGTYSVSYLDASGNQVGYIKDLDTSSISNNVCTSYPEPNPINDLNARVINNGCTVDPNNPPKIVWDPIGSQYEVYRDGQLIDTVSGTEFPGDVPGSYTIIAKDSNGNTIGQSDVNMQFVTDNGGGADNGADEICACIESLRPVLEEIRENTQQIHQDLLVTNDKLDVINGTLGQILNQITPERTYNVPSVPQSPDLYKPPTIGSGKFEDNTQYFTDPGSVDAPPPMPVAPEPKQWTDQDGNVMQQDAVIQKEPTMTKDQSMNRDPLMQRDPKMSIDPVSTRDQPLQKDPSLQVQTDSYPLRWKSSDYKP